jgi:beta-lactamase superfamily II metal-dependent hydrolase
MAKRKINKTKTVISSIFSILVGLVVGFVLNIYLLTPNSFEIPETVTTTNASVAVTGHIDADVVNDSDLSIHFLEIGNKYTGDCSLIKVGDVEMLIDAGSKASSIPTIKAYLDTYVEGDLDYVVVTHAHEDHYAGFATNENTQSLFDLFTVKNIIDFGDGTNKTTANKMYANYVRERDAEITAGATYFEAIDFFNGTHAQTFELGSGSGVYVQMLYHEFIGKSHPAETENDYSVCLQIDQNGKKYIFTGDLEKEGEESLVAENEAGGKNEGLLSEVELYKAGHHGSKTSSSKALLDVIQPKVVCVCCCAGSSEYTSKNENQFPTQEFINRVSIHTKQIFVTTLCVDYKAGKYESFNGNIVVCANNDGAVSVMCSNNTTYLKDTDWFKANRTLPAGAVA